jgi:hypothetical protein
MKSSKLLIILSLIVFITKGTAQKFQLGKVSINELKEKTHSIDTSAAASILYNNAKIVFKYDLKKRIFNKYGIR